jgi:hypothetical protein
VANDVDTAKKAEAVKEMRRKKKPQPLENKADENRAKLGIINPFSIDWQPIRRATNLSGPETKRG